MSNNVDHKFVLLPITFIGSLTQMQQEFLLDAQCGPSSIFLTVVTFLRIL